MGCRIPCRVMRHELHKLYDSEDNCDALKVHGIDGCEGLVGLWVLMTDSSVKVIEEHLLYDWSNFVADIGGYLGLLLGVSVLTLYHWMADVSGKIFRKVVMVPPLKK